MNTRTLLIHAVAFITYLVGLTNLIIVNVIITVCNEKIEVVLTLYTSAVTIFLLLMTVSMLCLNVVFLELSDKPIIEDDDEER